MIRGLYCRFQADVSIIVRPYCRGSAIRERIFSKLDIPDERQAHFSIYQAEIGTFAIGGALTNAVLFQLCREYGDPSGSLKFFVSTFPDRPPASYANYSTDYSQSSLPNRVR
ncbi:hypothetical protein BD779DRAFT_1677552 [Infundibulicybe gibba]|nr:hypothetical protein BD779DRAFT_1677552 [Infundibulicybe gibba]